MKSATQKLSDARKRKYSGNDRREIGGAKEHPNLALALNNLKGASIVTISQTKERREEIVNGRGGIEGV